jgi:ornithine carbamoyltransferase
MELPAAAMRAAASTWNPVPRLSWPPSFSRISDYSSDEIQDMLDLAIKLKKEYFKKGNKPIFKGKVLGMIFQKPSLRTRVSFDMAMRHWRGRCAVPLSE